MYWLKRKRKKEDEKEIQRLYEVTNVHDYHSKALLKKERGKNMFGSMMSSSKKGMDYDEERFLAPRQKIVHDHSKIENLILNIHFLYQKTCFSMNITYLAKERSKIEEEKDEKL